jgi:hypothetical protein
MLNLLIVPVRTGELPTIPPVPEAVSTEPQAETDAEFHARLDRMVAAAGGPPTRREAKPLSSCRRGSRRPSGNPTRTSRTYPSLWQAS